MVIYWSLEDIGRHNAFDKAIASIRNQFDAKILVFSRIGWELVAKGVRSGVELIIAEQSALQPRL